MKEKLQEIVKEARELIGVVPDSDNQKRKILLHRAKKAIDTFELAMTKLIE